MQASQLSIVVQGEVSTTTQRALGVYRALAPEAQIILSTYEDFEPAARYLRKKGLMDVVVINEDPGPLPPTVKSATAGPNNLNRMLISTQAGLARADREFTLKVRSDALIHPVRVMRRWKEEGGSHRLLFASRYTRHPFGINGYLFHVSDWITFGRTPRCRDYWSAPLMDEADASYFERTPMPDDATPTAKRFRARMSQEQWICGHFARAIGYDAPSRLAQRTPHLVRQYIEFLAQECIVCDRESLGLELPKHERSFASVFQRIDCLSEADWADFKNHFYSNRHVTPGWRMPAFLTRKLLSALVLLRKRLLS